MRMRRWCRHRPLRRQTRLLPRLLIRLLPARREAFVSVPAGHENFPLVLSVYEALEAWIDRHGLIAIDSPYEIYPGSGGADFDIAYPVNS